MLLKVKDGALLKLQYEITIKLDLQDGFYSRNYLKDRLTEIYSDFNIVDKPKAVDILNYYDGVPKTMRVDGKVTKGFLILKSKVTIK